MKGTHAKNVSAINQGLFRLIGLGVSTFLVIYIRILQCWGIGARLGVGWTKKPSKQIVRERVNGSKQSVLLYSLK